MSDHPDVDEYSAALQSAVEASILAALCAAKRSQDKFLVYMLAIAAEHLSECRKSKQVLASSTP